MVTREQLIELRRSLAGKWKVYPASIFDDALLEVLVEKKPQTLRELEQISGFPKGGVRVTRYGADIVGLFSGKDYEVERMNKFE